MSQRCELAAREPAANRPCLIGWFPYLNEVNVTHFLFAASCQTQHTVVNKFPLPPPRHHLFVPPSPIRLLYTNSPDKACSGQYSLLFVHLL